MEIHKRIRLHFFSPRFGKVMGKSRVSCFLTHGVHVFVTISSRRVMEGLWMFVHERVGVRQRKRKGEERREEDGGREGVW